MFAQTDASLSLCYVDHHDNAYDWAAAQAAEPTKTGAAQLVGYARRVQEIKIIPSMSR
ncbi:MAG: hypothetical protein IPN81_06905 [Nitrosomonadales bacterium]|nr:hypothetical protein [Nitrosomonadales bacterium]